MELNDKNVTIPVDDDDVDMSPIDSAVTIRIDHWEDLLRLAQLMKFGEWIFRGQEDVAWGLTTGVERELNARKKNLGLDKTQEGTNLLGIDDLLAYDMALPYDHEHERKAVATFRKLGTRDIKDMSSIEVLATMQHYGAKTRLLDFSLSMFVALFFAFENKTAAHDRVLYALQVKKLLETSPLIVNKVKSRAKENGYGQECVAPEDENNMLCDAKKALVGDVVSRDRLLLDIANAEVDGDGSDMGVIPVFVTGANKRIVAQDGLFLLPLNFDSFKSNLASTLETTEDKVDVVVNKDGSVSDETIPIKQVERRLLDITLLRVVLSKKLEYGAWQILSQANINPMSIYPDLVGLAKSMRY